MTTRKPPFSQRCFHFIERWAIREFARRKSFAETDEGLSLRLARRYIGDSQKFNTARSNLEYWMGCGPCLQTKRTIGHIDYTFLRCTKGRRYYVMRGWFFDLQSATRSFFFETPTRRPPLTLFPCARADVQQAFPGVPHAYWSGFEAVIPVHVLPDSEVKLTYRVSGDIDVSFHLPLQIYQDITADLENSAQILVVVGKYPSEGSIVINSILDLLEKDSLSYSCVAVCKPELHDSRLSSAEHFVRFDSDSANDAFWYSHGGLADSVLVLGEVPSKDFTELAGTILSGIDPPSIFAVRFTETFDRNQDLACEEQFYAYEADTAIRVATALRNCRKRKLRAAEYAC